MEEKKGEGSPEDLNELAVMRVGGCNGGRHDDAVKLNPKKKKSCVFRDCIFQATLVLRFLVLVPRWALYVPAEEQRQRTSLRYLQL